MAKIRVADFDPLVCLGDHPQATGPCPHLVPTDEDTGRGVVDRLRKAEMKALRAVSEPQEGACDACGCPLVNLGAFDMAPEECPRIALHGGER